MPLRPVQLRDQVTSILSSTLLRRFMTCSPVQPARAIGTASAASIISPDEYATRSQDFFSREGFFENSVSSRVEVWDHIAHVWSTYESRHAKGEKPFARGINSFQLFNDGSRWWILTVYWEGEDPTHPLPEKYLK